MVRPLPSPVTMPPSVRRAIPRALLALSLLAPGPVGAADPGDRSRSAQSGTAEEGAIWAEGFESRHAYHWDVQIGLAPLDPIDSASALSKVSITLPGGGSNAIERSHVIHYLGTGKSIDSSPRRQLPYRAYFASCAVDSANPRMFVSLTLADTSGDANPDFPEVGSVFETRYDPVTGLLTPTGNEAVLDLCNQTHGITASSDCSRVAVLCATANEEPVSETYPGTFRDLVEEGREDYFYTTQTDNESIIDGISGLTPAERQARYQYNGEMWLLEWDGGKALSDEPEKFVIHKGFGGGNPWSAPSLVYSETDNSYGAAFATNLFDTNHGGRHWSAALMIVERDGWKLNPDDRGWGWLCAYGHVFNVRAFWNPFETDDRAGEFGALCTSDGNTYSGRLGGTIGIKHESSDFFEGYSNYLVPSNNSGVTNGGGHAWMPIDATRSIGLLVGPEMEPFDDPAYAAHIARAERSAINSLGADEAAARGLKGLAACNWWADGPCLFDYMAYEHSGTYPLYDWGFWWKTVPNFVPSDLSKIGIFHTKSSGQNIPQKDGALVKWVAEDDDCMLGAPQLVDLRNGRYLLGYGKFQCISDGFELRRFATGANGTRSVATLIPSEYVLMEIDADGYPLTAPTVVPASGWGGLDRLVGLGEGRAAWAYIPAPELASDGTFPSPGQATWDLLVYESPLD